MNLFIFQVLKTNDQVLVETVKNLLSSPTRCVVSSPLNLSLSPHPHPISSARPLFFPWLPGFFAQFPLLGLVFFCLVKVQKKWWFTWKRINYRQKPSTREILRRPQNIPVRFTKSNSCQMCPWFGHLSLAGGIVFMVSESRQMLH